MLGQRLSGLLDSLDPMYTLEPDAEEQVLKMADTFMEQVTRQGLLMARHRGSNTLDVKDLQLVLQKQWGIVVPGLGAPPSRNQRIATIRGATSTASNATSSDGGNDSKDPPAITTTMTTGSGNKRRPSTSSATSNFSNRSKKTKTNATTHSAAATTS
jgi:transcription initiation factor TFIID subunit 12